MALLSRTNANVFDEAVRVTEGEVPARIHLIGVGGMSVLHSYLETSPTHTANERPHTLRLILHTAVGVTVLRLRWETLPWLFCSSESQTKAQQGPRPFPLLS